MLYNDVAANRQPRTEMPNSCNIFLFIKIFFRTNCLIEQLSFVNTIYNYTNTTLKNAVRVERLVSCNIESIKKYLSKNIYSKLANNL